MGKPFTVSAEWTDYAHGPAAEDGNEDAIAILTSRTNSRGSVVISDPALVRELVSVAELYDGGSNVQDDERLWFRSYPSRLISRGKKWLALQ